MKILARLLNPRALAIATIAAIVLSLSAPFALAQTPSKPAEAFLQTNIQKGIAILSDKSAAPAQTAAQFRAFLESLTDIRRIALFTLGPAAKTAAPGDVNAFVAAFQDYATAVYQSQLSQYSGEGLAVIGSTEHAPGDFIVQTKVTDANGRVESGGDEVDFRVVGNNGSFQVLDASVSGIWLAANERDQFAGFLAQHNNDVAALTAHLKDVTAGMQAK